MIKLAILVAVSVLIQQICCDEPERIVGGNTAVTGQFRHQASLQFLDFHFCGGSIIDSTHILTAAHCLDDDFANQTVVVTGANDLRISGEKHEIKCFRMHPDYTGAKEGGWKHDIAMITLKDPIKENNVQGPIRLASKNYNDGNKHGIVSGWGNTQPTGEPADILQWVKVKVLSHDHCLKDHKRPPTSENHICTLEAVGTGVCQGDSGGPLVVDNELVGIVSWAIFCAYGKSDVYTNVYSYLDFIQDSLSMC